MGEVDPYAKYNRPWWWHKFVFPVKWWWWTHTWHPNCECYIAFKGNLKWTQRVSLWLHGFKRTESATKDGRVYIR